MEPRILLLSKDKVETNNLKQIFQANNIFLRYESVNKRDIKSLLIEIKINVILLDESCFSMLGDLNYIVKDASIIILLHHSDEEIIQTSMNYKVDGFLLKPRYYNLMPTIYQTLEQKTS